jgi:hypothetical protein
VPALAFTLAKRGKGGKRGKGELAGDIRYPFSAGWIIWKLNEKIFSKYFTALIRIQFHNRVLKKPVE